MHYVLLKHENNGDFHVDILLDCGQERLLTWQIGDHDFIDWLKFDGNFFNFAESPNHTNDTFYSKCRRIFDHQRKYLDFSGELGESRGHITRIEYGKWELHEICAKQIVIKMVGVLLAEHSPITRHWRFEPPVEIALDLNGSSPGRLMQQLPPPGDGNWVVSCTQGLCEH